jgi:hypothetical protein
VKGKGGYVWEEEERERKEVVKGKMEFVEGSRGK